MPNTTTPTTAPASDMPPGKLQTWTFVGHWEDDRIVVEYVLPGDVKDERLDTGFWEQGLWAAPYSGRTLEEAQKAVIASYESEYEDDLRVSTLN